MVLDSELIDAIRRPSAADESEQATDERVASAVASLFAKSAPPAQPWPHSDAIAEAIDHGLATTTRALLGCGATAGDDALHRAAASRQRRGSCLASSVFGLRPIRFLGSISSLRLRL